MLREAFYVKMVLRAGTTRLGAAVTLTEYLTQMLISQTSKILQASAQGDLISRIRLNQPNLSPAPREAKLRSISDGEGARGPLAPMPNGRGHATADYKKEKLGPIAEKRQEPTGRKEGSAT